MPHWRIKSNFTLFFGKVSIDFTLIWDNSSKVPKVFYNDSIVFFFSIKSMYLMWDFILSPLIWCTISLVGCTSGMDWSPIPLYRLSSWIASFLRRGSVVQTLKMMIQPKMSKSKKCKKFSTIWFLFEHTHHKQTIWCVLWYVNLSV